MAPDTSGKQIGRVTSRSVTARGVTAGSVTARSVTAGSITASSVTTRSDTAGSVTARSVTAGIKVVVTFLQLYRMGHVACTQKQPAETLLAKSTKGTVRKRRRG